MTNAQRKYAELQQRIRDTARRKADSAKEIETVESMIARARSWVLPLMRRQERARTFRTETSVGHLRVLNGDTIYCSGFLTSTLNFLL